MDVTELLDLPLDEAAKVVAHIRPRDADELYWWVKNFTGYVLPRKKVCENHVAPLMAIWKIFEEEILDAILFANRSGGKTVGMAVLNLLDMEFKPGCEIATVGAILPQARKGYKYLTQMLQSPLFNDDVVETLMRETSLANGASVEIVSSTTSGLNSPHPNKARADEVELMDWDSVQQFFSMAVSSPGIRAQQVLSSTRKTLTGSMQKLLDRCEKDPSFTFQVLAWCIWETVQTCEMPDCEECKKVIRSDNESFFEHCAGKAREADGFYAIEDAWRKFKLLDPDVWDAEWEGKKPSTGGLVVGKQLDDAVHWLPWVVYDPRLVSLGGVDFGYDAPFAAGVGQINQNRDLTMIDEYYGSELTLTTHIIPKLLQMQEEYRVLVWFCDATAPMQIMDLRNAGVRAVPCSRDRKASYNNVRAYLTGHITNKPRFAMSQKMENFKRDFMTCHFMKGQQDAVHNEHSHGVDAVAYLIWGILYKLDKILGGDGGKGGGELPTSGGDGRGTHGRRHRA